MSSDTNPTYLTPSEHPPGSQNNGARGKPTILAFHGSGSNATVHTVQLARLKRLLSPHFEVMSLLARKP